MQQIIRLEDTDDITAIRTRVEFALAGPVRQEVAQQTGNKPVQPRLLLLVPRKNKALQSLVNMKLLARIAKNNATEIAIISSNPTVRDNAKVAGVKAFGTRRAARWGGWITSQTQVASPESTLPPVVPPPGETEAAKSAKKPDRTKKKKFVVVSGDKRPGGFKYIAQQLGLIILIVILALALVVGFIGLLPEATVTITPVAEPVEAELVVRADPNAKSTDFANLTFPARIDQVELKLAGQVDTVDTELAPGDKSVGQVTFINRIEDGHIIPYSTTLTTSAGEAVEFLTVQTTTIPAGIGSTTTTQVIAVEPGPRGNVGAGQINRFVDPAKDLLARVVNEQSTEAGTFSPAKIIVEADKPRLDAHLRQMVQQEGLAQLKAALGEQEFISPESVEVIVMDVKYNEFSGDFSNTFSGEMQAVIRATVVGGYNANRLALAALETQVPPGYDLDVEGLQFGAGEVLGLEDGVVSFVIFASGSAMPVIDNHAVAKDVAWMSIGEAQDMLSRQYKLATVPGVDLQPAWLVEWLGRLPYSPFKIDVIINEPVSAVVNGG